MQQTLITLTAAELYVLRDLDGSTGREAFKLTLTELLARGVIRFHRETRMILRIFPQEENYLALVPSMRDRASSKPQVSAVLDVVARAQEQPFGAPMENVVRDARRGLFGKDLSSYKSDFVIPALVREGMVVAREEKSLGLFSRTKFVPTVKGQEILAELKELTAHAASLPKMAKEQPEEALALLSVMGSALILIPELRPHYHGIGTDLSGVPHSMVDGLDGDFASGDFAAQFDAGWAGLLDSFDDVADTFDSVLDTFDGSFDAADGGGGDGGDGGGDGGD